MRLITLLAAVLLLTVTSHAQTRAWLRTYAGLGYDVANDMVPTSDGGAVVVGASNVNVADPASPYRLLVVRIDPHGDVVWSTAIGERPATIGQAILALDDGSYAILGIAREGSGAAAKNDLFVMRIDSNGLMLAETVIATPDIHEQVADAIRTADGGFVIAGSHHHAVQNTTPMVMKVDAAGTEIWRKLFSGNGQVSGLVEMDGGLIAAAGSARPEASAPVDVFLRRLDADGASLSFWSPSVNENEFAPTLVAGAFGSIALAYFTATSATHMMDTVTFVRFVAGGSIVGDTAYSFDRPAPAPPSGLVSLGLHRRAAGGFWFTAAVTGGGGTQPMIAPLDERFAPLGELRLSLDGQANNPSTVIDHGTHVLLLGQTFVQPAQFFVAGIEPAPAAVPIARAVGGFSLEVLRADEDAIELRYASEARMTTRFELVDIRGDVVATSVRDGGQSDAERVVMPLPAGASGLYLLRARRGDSQATARVVIP